MLEAHHDLNEELNTVLGEVYPYLLFSKGDNFEKLAMSVRLIVRACLHNDEGTIKEHLKVIDPLLKEIYSSLDIQEKRAFEEFKRYLNGAENYNRELQNRVGELETDFTDLKSTVMGIIDAKCLDSQKKSISLKKKESDLNESNEESLRLQRGSLSNQLYPFSKKDFFGKDKKEESIQEESIQEESIQEESIQKDPVKEYNTSNKPNTEVLYDIIIRSPVPLSQEQLRESSGWIHDKGIVKRAVWHLQNTPGYEVVAIKAKDYYPENESPCHGSTYLYGIKSRIVVDLLRQGKDSSILD